MMSLLLMVKQKARQKGQTQFKWFSWYSFTYLHPEEFPRSRGVLPAVWGKRVCPPRTTCQHCCAHAVWDPRFLGEAAACLALLCSASPACAPGLSGPCPGWWSAGRRPLNCTNRLGQDDGPACLPVATCVSKRTPSVLLPHISPSIAASPGSLLLLMTHSPHTDSPWPWREPHARRPISILSERASGLQ